jgi:peroxiredoxin
MRDEAEHKADRGAVEVGARRGRDAAGVRGRDAEGVGLYQLPADLPVPIDDGACDHLNEATMPTLRLDSSCGPVDLAELASVRAVLYVYPRTGRPDRPVPEDWNAIPGARGCTPQTCGFRDHAQELEALGARVAGLSVQPPEEQRELADRLGIAYPVIADPERRLGAALGLPTFEFEGLTLYKRVTLVFEQGLVSRVFYPVFPPDRNAEEVVAWLGS